MKIIFLDVDGVLNSVEGHYGMPEDDKMKRLKHIVEQTGAKVVISSTWRMGKDSDEKVRGSSIHRMYVGLLKILSDNGIEVIGNTPQIWKGRGNEIDTWLKESEYEVDSFVILDVDVDMEPYLDRLVHTDYYVGLQDEEAEEAIDLLLGKREVSQYYLDKDYIALI